MVRSFALTFVLWVCRIRFPRGSTCGEAKRALFLFLSLLFPFFADVGFDWRELMRRKVLAREGCGTRVVFPDPQRGTGGTRLPGLNYCFMIVASVVVFCSLSSALNMADLLPVDRVIVMTPVTLPSRMSVS
jgi:hypothetical protein